MSEPLKIGLVGLDSSHCVEYAGLLHDAAHAHHVPGARIVAAFPGGSRDWALSATRLDGFCDRMENEFGVPLAVSIDEVTERSDAIMILSVDGRVHRAQFDAVAKSGKPVYIDKPLSVSVADAKHIHTVAHNAGTRVFSASVWRFSRGLKVGLDALEGPCHHAHLHGQWPLEAGLHGWFHYGIHQAEMLYAVMGPGCQRVACLREGMAEVVTGFWPDGRVGTITTNHDEPRPFGGWLLGKQRTALVEVKDTKHERYQAFLQAALEFFRGEGAPVPLSETLETIAFLGTAANSAARSGATLPIQLQTL